MKEPVPAKKFKILFLCTGNSARSILAEYFLRRLRSRFVAHWGSDDPDAADGDAEAKRQAVRKVAMEIHRRLGLFTSLPMESLDRLRLEEMIRAIGRT